MAHKKGLGSSRNGRDSNAQRLGVKMFAGEAVTGGEIIVRQRGSRFKAGEGVGMGKDDTLFVKAPGFLQFTENRRGRVVNVISADEQALIEARGEGGGVAVAERPGAEAASEAPAGSAPGDDAPGSPPAPAA